MYLDESIRIEAFRQLKKKIRGSKDHLIVGIDIAKDKHRAFFGTATGKTLLKQLVFEDTREAFERLLMQTEALKVRHGITKIVFGLEPTTNYHKPLGEFLIKGGHQVVRRSRSNLYSWMLISRSAVLKNKD